MDSIVGAGVGAAAMAACGSSSTSPSATTYSGRATHIHVDVYRSGTIVKSTQIAFPETVSSAVYASGVYASKGQNATNNANDNVFSDGVTNELATVTGSATSGYTAMMNIGIQI